MIQAALGVIDKMRIEVYDKSDYKSDPQKTIFVQLNPEKFTMKHSVSFTEGQPIGASNSNLAFNRIEGEEVVFDFLFDSSGVVPPGKIKEGKGTMSAIDSAGETGNVVQPAMVNPLAQVKSVEEEVEAFKNLLLGYNGDTHQTTYLQLLWGGYSLKCRLKTMEIEYYVFRKDGRPVRAKVKCTFKESTSYKTMVEAQKKSSPDLTHQREIRMNDKLSLIAEKIYENPSFYIDVANANMLLSFRHVPDGKILSFPPIK
jgi:hypothetical protein